MSIRAWIYRFGYPCAKFVWFFCRPKSEGIMAIIRERDDILFIRQSYRTKNWCLPGGGMDNGESPREACIREVREETGLIATAATELWSFPWTKEFKRDTVHMFAVQAMGTIQVDGDEVIEARWFNRRKLPADIDTIAELAMNYLDSIT